MRDIGIVWKLFYQIPYKDVVLWSVMISACVKNGQYNEAFDIFREMQNQGGSTKPSKYFTCLC